VEAAYALFNSGDPAFAEIRVKGSLFATPEDEEAEINLHREWIADGEIRGARMNVSGCAARGSGEWPGVADPGVATPSGHYFICQSTETDALLTIAGIELPATYHWVVSDGAVVAVVGSADWARGDVFIDAFVEWLEVAHPEAAADITPLFEDVLLDDPTVWSQILDYAEEFVAQSDVYPLESTDS
jgi:hypothetical protein